MTTAHLLSTLRERGVRISAEDGRLKCDAPPGVLDDALQAQIAEHKEELLALLAGADTVLSAPRSLVPLKPSGEHPPLFARPGHNGDVFCYRGLATYIDPYVPLYGVEPLGVDGSPTPDTVEEIAAYEVAQIREFQPDGPYYIAGYCAGGAIAFESARQLADGGADVARVLLFGSPFPTTYRISQVRSYLRTQNYRVRRHTADVTAGSFAEGVEYIRSRARARVAEAGERLDPVLAENRRRVEDATLAAVKRYEPGFYAGRVDVFFPSEAWRTSGDQPDEWRLVAGQVVEHIGPDRCDGDYMLREPHVPALATLVNQALRDEEERHATG